MITTIVILSILVIILGYTTINLMRKNEVAEDIVVNYLQYLDKISRVIDVSEKRLKDVDINGSFEGDDEVGFFFKTINNYFNW